MIQRVLAHSFWVLQAVTPVECVRGPRQGAEVWKSVFSVFCLMSWAVCTRKSVGETCLLRRSGGVGKIQVVFGRGAKLEHGRLQGLCQTLHKHSTPVSRGLGVSPQQRSASISEVHSSRLRLAPARPKSATQKHHRSLPRASQAARLLVPGS